MEVKELPNSYVAELREMKSQLAYLLESKLIADFVGCINLLRQFSSWMLVELMGKKLQNVPDDVRKHLLTSFGPFSRRKRQKKRTCGTYFELLQHYVRHPNPEFGYYLCKVEEMVIEKFSHIDGFPNQPESLRKMFYDFISKGRAFRDVRTHIALLPPMVKEEALRLIEENLGILVKCGLDSISPLVMAGVHILRHGIQYAGEDDLDEDDFEEEIASTSAKEGHNFILPHQRSVKVTFVAKKQLKLGHAVSIFGNHTLLGESMPGHAIQMSCADGYTWSKVFRWPVGENIQYSFVIVKIQEGNKWVITDGPIGNFTVNVGALSSITVETNLEDY